jgi:hypothetical protein
MALAHLRDIHGNIDLSIPVAADESGTSIGIGTVIAQALRRALLNALAAPLKLFGAVFGAGDGQASLPPAAIAFRPGRDEPAPGAEQMAGQLAELLASRPGVGVTLTAIPSPKDARWLAEQALREEFEGQGVFGAIRHIAERGVRERVRAALGARAKDEEAPLPPEDEEALDRWLAERPPIPAERLDALAQARVERVETLLRERHGVGGERVSRGTPGEAAAPEPDAPAGQPEVRLELGSLATE